MCRFVLYQGVPLSLASLVVDPANSIIKQSLKARETDDPLNGDGFGVAWYVHEISQDPALFRSFTPAWSNHNLLELAKVTRSGCILAHVRAATPGFPVTELDCHPFKHGKHAMMHNGDLGGFRHIRRKLLSQLSDKAFATIEGGTDSEHIFATVLDRLWRSEVKNHLERMSTSLIHAIRDLIDLARREGEAEHSYLNIALTDGYESVITRFTTDEPRHASSLSYHTGRRYVCEGDVCRMVEPEKGQGAVLVCSEPLSDDPGWQTVPANHMVLVNSERTVEVRPINL